MSIREQSTAPWDRPHIEFYGDDGGTSLSNLATDKGQLATNLSVGAGTDVVYEASPASRLAGLYPREFSWHLSTVPSGAKSFLHAHSTANDDELTMDDTTIDFVVNASTVISMPQPAGTAMLIALRSEANPATTGASDAVLSTLEVWDLTNTTMYRKQASHVAIPNPTTDFTFLAADTAGTSSVITNGGTCERLRVSSRAVAFTEIALDWLAVLDDNLLFAPKLLPLRDPINDSAGTVSTGGTVTYDEDLDSLLLAATTSVSWSSISDMTGAAISISVWVRISALATGATAFRILKTGGSAITLVIDTSRRIQFTRDYATTDKLVVTTDTLTVDTWYHVVVTDDGSVTASNAHVYIDNVEASYTTQQNAVGAESNADGAWGIGLKTGDAVELSDLRVYSAVMNSNQIAYLADNPRFSTDALLRRQGLHPNETSGIGNQAEYHGTAVQWAARELHHNKYRCMGALMNWRMQTVIAFTETVDTDAATQAKIRLAPGGTIASTDGYLAHLGWSAHYPVSPTCNYLWVQIHARCHDADGVESPRFGFRLYVSDGELFEAGVDYRYVTLATFEADEAAPGSWRIQALVPVVRSDDGFVWLSLAAAVDIDADTSGAQIEVNAIHTVQIDRATTGNEQGPAGGPLGVGD